MTDKEDRQVKHIIASEMAGGKSRKEAEQIAYAHVLHPKPEKESKAEDKKEKGK